MKKLKLSELYLKDIDRDIKGVIKVGQDDSENISIELDEYVVTDELLKHFETFFSAYHRGVEQQTDKMGVWISGFFGSGKSHFLKILSYALANKTVDHKSTLDFFKDKITDTTIIKDMTFASNLTTDVMLFNIDAKSTATSKNDKEAIFHVFNNVFNEMQGFSGITPWLADFERYLTEKEKYEEFKANFEDVYGSSWVESREDADYIADEIVEAYVKTLGATEEAARHWIENAEQNFTLNIELFAKRINEYLEKKGPAHQIIFLVDEIGQYIGEDSKLMLNLQTVVEELGLRCHGRVWVLVTSQQDIDAVAEKVKGNDFSKILGRFDTRLSLSSRNVDEVIRKRLLEKNEVAKATLNDLFIQQQSSLKNLLTFSSDTAEMKIYNNAQEFIDFYPFIPYQFKLLQQVFNGIRIKGASGKHLSEGERSLLSAFQESAIQNMNEELGYLIPFSTFYKTIESFLEPTVVRAIANASANERLTDFDVEVLKVLFLVKYAKEIKAKKENITTLMLSNIHEDKLELGKKIEESLKRLVHETLIQQNGEVYDFLTNDEQDINREIKNIAIDSTAIVKKVGELIVDDIYSDTKYRLNKYHSFNLTRKIDDINLSPKTHEIGFNIITPYYGLDYSETELKVKSMNDKLLIIQLPQETINYLNEVEESLKIERFVQLKNGTDLSPGIQEIVARKSKEVIERRDRARSYLKEALKSAKLYANMQEVTINAKEPKERINDGLKMMIESLFNKLGYIEQHFESLKQLEDWLVQPHQASTITSNSKMEILQYIQTQQLKLSALTIKEVLDKFSQPPFGWLELDTVGQLISLYKDKQLNFKYNHEYLSAETPKKFIELLTNSNYTSRVVIERREVIEPKLIKVVKSLMKEMFDNSFVTEDEDQLMVDFKQEVQKELNTIVRLIDKTEQGVYPGYETLLDGKELCERILQEKNLKSVYQLVYKLEDDLLDYHDEVESIKAFYQGEQLVTYQKALNVIKIYERNSDYLQMEEIAEAIGQLKQITSTKEPYNKIQNVHALKKQFDDNFKLATEEQAQPLLEQIKEDKASLLMYANNLESQEAMISKIKSRYYESEQRLLNPTSFDMIFAEKYKLDSLKENLYKEITVTMDRENKNRIQAAGIKEETQPVVPKKKRKIYRLAEITKKLKTIETEQDIDVILTELKKELEAQLQDDTIIELW